MSAPLFDLSKPAVRAIPSSFGGGWVIPITDEGTRVLTEYFGEGPAEIPVPVGEGAFPLGWIVEPQEAGDLAEYLHNEKIAWSVE